MGNSESSKNKTQDFRYINGRQYHNEPEASYIFPSDLDEMDRQQQQHYCFKHIFRSNMSAPVEQILNEGCKVLDIGCGAGIWLLELSTEYERSEFFGVDMSPVFPTHIKPFNSNFIKANVLHGLPFPPNKFEYIHLSFMHSSFKDEQWQNIVIPELIRVLKPDGWLEFYEVDVIHVNGGPLIDRLTRSVQKRLTDANQNPRLGSLYKRWLSSHTCLKDVREIVKYPYIGEWEGIIIEDNDVVVEEEDFTESEECVGTKVDHLNKAKTRADVVLGRLLLDTLKTYYTVDSDALSNCMGVTKEEFLGIVGESFEREIKEYDTRMKFLRVICRKENESS